MAKAAPRAMADTARGQKIYGQHGVPTYWA
jgi:hypothetical protein